MVSALDAGSSGLRKSAGLDILLYSWPRHLTLTVLLSMTEGYKLVPANLILVGGDPAMDQHPFQGGVNERRPDGPLGL